MSAQPYLGMLTIAKWLLLSFTSRLPKARRENQYRDTGLDPEGNLSIIDPLKNVNTFWSKNLKYFLKTRVLFWRDFENLGFISLYDV